ncbi:hypothetical protein [Candidatus Electronema sp. JM]|uniref:hypothetical protein n=1 Tax=Candidatus Electronema sp. JM TaxID=3401571 RepID=UPI003AA923D6
MRTCLLSFCAAVLLSACVHAAEQPPPALRAELIDFAKANCFYWYFSKKGYDLKDVRAISGGIVERGTASPEEYERVSLLVKQYRPPLRTKQNIDIDLLKCFTMEHDAAFLRSLTKAQ